MLNKVEEQLHLTSTSPAEEIYITKCDFSCSSLNIQSSKMLPTIITNPTVGYVLRSNAITKA
jgi:hypothetical protein